MDYWAVDLDYFQRKEIEVPVGSGLSGIASRHCPASSHPRANWLWPPSRGAGPNGSSYQLPTFTIRHTAAELALVSGR